MNFKKTCATLIAASLLATSPAWALAQSAEAANDQPVSLQSDVNRMVQQALNQLSQLVPELKDFPIISINSSENDGDESVIHIMLRTYEKQKYPYATVELDPKYGEIVGFGINRGEKGNDNLELDQEKAKQSATAFLERLLKEEAKQYQVADSFNGQHNGTVLFNRTVNGITLLGGGITVFLDQDANVTGYHKNVYGHYFKDLSLFPEPKELIGEQAAIQAMGESLRLVYAEGNGQTGPVLKYVPELPGYVDAKTGTVVPSPGPENKFSAPVTVTPQAKRLTAKTREEAAAVLKNELSVDVAGAEFTEESESDFREFVWTDQDKTKMYVYTDSQTGRVIQFGIHRFKRDGEPRITREEAARKAVAFLEQYLDKNVTTVQVSAFDSAPGTTDLENFYIHKSHQGIPVEDHFYQVTVDLRSGNVTEVAGPFEREQIALPDSSKAVAKAEAVKEFVNTHSAKLFYYAFDASGKRAAAPSLVYEIRAESPGYIDALTGKTVEEKREK